MKYRTFLKFGPALAALSTTSSLAGSGTVMAAPMRKQTFISSCAIALLLFLLAASSASAQSSYAEDRALIEDLQARYMFALDFQDADAYASTFTKNGVLDSADGVIRGHEAIRNYIVQNKKNWEAMIAKDASGLRPPVGRHNITNITIKIDGDRAMGRAYWFIILNFNPERSPTIISFGHYEDEMVKTDGKWLFSKRKIFNEQREDRAATGSNPAW